MEVVVHGQRNDKEYL